MKSRTALGLALAAMMILAGSSTFAQDSNSNNLGDYARQVRKQKPPTSPTVKTFDNDNLPRTDKLSVVGDAAAPAADEAASQEGAATATAGDQATGDANAPVKTAAKGEGAAKDPQSDKDAEKDKADQEWQSKIHDQQNKIDALAKELDITNREYRLRAAAFYADAGNRLRNSGEWDKEDADYKDQISGKQKELDQAKQQLEDMQEDARKSGVPSSMRE